MGRVTSSSSASTVGIKDTAGNDLTSTSGALDVNVINTASTGLPIAIYAEIDNLAMGASEDIIVYTVPVSKTFYLARVLISSDSISEFDISIDSVQKGKLRVGYGNNYNLSFEFLVGATGLPLATGSVVTITATNNSQVGPGSFNATLVGSE